MPYALSSGTSSTAIYGIGSLLLLLGISPVRPGFCRCAAFEEVSEGWVRAVPGGLPELQERYAQTAVGKLGLVKSPGRPDRLVVDSSVSGVTEHTALLILDVSKANRRIMIRPSDRGLLCFFHRRVLYQCLTLN